jgi:hypothetical protein
LPIAEAPQFSPGSRCGRASTRDHLGRARARRHAPRRDHRKRASDRRRSGLGSEPRSAFRSRQTRWRRTGRCRDSCMAVSDVAGGTVVLLVVIKRLFQFCRRNFRNPTEPTQSQLPLLRLLWLHRHCSRVGAVELPCRAHKCAQRFEPPVAPAHPCPIPAAGLGELPGHPFCPSHRTGVDRAKELANRKAVERKSSERRRDPLRQPRRRGCAERSPILARGVSRVLPYTWQPKSDPHRCRV